MRQRPHLYDFWNNTNPCGVLCSVLYRDGIESWVVDATEWTGHGMEKLPEAPRPLLTPTESILRLSMIELQRNTLNVVRACLC